MKKALISALVFTAISCSGQPLLPDYLESITAKEIEKHVNTIASDEMEGRRTGTRGFDRAAEYVISEFRSYGLKPLPGNDFRLPVPLRITTTKQGNTVIKAADGVETAEYKPLTSFNVAGLMKGSDPQLSEEFIVVCAHLDHLGIRNNEIYNGANDNASGCGAVLEMAEALAQKGNARSVIFLLYCAEEEGLLGSQYFVHSPPVPLEKIIACINIDHAGRRDTRLKGILAAADYNVFPELKDLVKRASANTGIRIDYNDEKTLTDRQFKGSDHYSFHQAGIPSIVFSTLGFPGYHTPEDDAHLIDYSLNQRVARISMATLDLLANSK